jgi:hypothetical protein
MAKTILLDQIPEALHRELETHAALAGLSLSDFLVRELRRIAEQPMLTEMLQRLSRIEPYSGKLSPTEVLREERDSR